MYRVVLAEDELFVRLGIKNSIDWSRLGMQVVADVQNGQEAWEAYEREAPEVLITDLNMPILDGMTLIQRIRERDEHIRIVILTCLHEFELVRKALSLGVNDYILKLNMTPGEMEQVLEKATHQLKTHTKQRQIDIVDPDIVKENLLKDYLFRQRYSAAEFAEHAQRIGLNLTPGKLLICLMEINRFDVLRSKFQDEHGQLIRMSLLNMLAEVLRDYASGEVFHDADNRYLLLFGFADRPNATQADAEMRLGAVVAHIRKVLYTYFNVSARFGASTARDGFESLKRQYRESFEALRESYFEQKDAIVFHGRRASQADGRAIRRQLSARLPERSQEGADFDEYWMTWLAQAWDNETAYAPADVVAKLSEALERCALALRVPQDDPAASVGRFAHSFGQAQSFGELAELFGEALERLRRDCRKRRKISKEVAAALRIVERSYMQDLSLQMVADQVQMSANYLSTLFKKEMEIGLVDYLNNVRIGKAKELLLGTHLKTYEIAERVGFEDNAYFSRMFKKLVGVTATEFRKEWVAEWEE